MGPPQTHALRHRTARDPDLTDRDEVLIEEIDHDGHPHPCVAPLPGPEGRQRHSARLLKSCDSNRERLGCASRFFTTSDTAGTWTGIVCSAKCTIRNCG